MKNKTINAKSKKLNSKNWQKLILLYNTVFATVALAFYPLIPKILCYPPNSIDNLFQVQINGLTYSQQYIAIVFSSLLIENIILIFSLKKINKLQSKIINVDNKKDASTLYYALAKKVLSTPNIIYLLQVIVPVAMIALTFSSLDGKLFITLKVCIMFFAMLTLVASIAYIFSKKLFKNILINIFNEISNFTTIDSSFTKYVKKSSMINSIFAVTLPIFIVTALFMALTSYAMYIYQTGNLTYKIYNTSLNTLNFNDFQNEESVENYLSDKLSNITKLRKEDTFFIIHDDKIIASDNSELSIFFTKYMDEITPTLETPNRIYDFYGDDSQGVFRNITINGENYRIGFRYTLASTDILIILLTVFIILFFISILILSYFGHNIVMDIKMVSDRLLQNCKSNHIDSHYKLPVISNDEIGDLVNAFNKTQDLTAKNIEQIHNNQETLMEKERLASLGQLIGGIAHNLKTPIMSISGAAEGLTDLIKEYDSSIDDPEVNSEDHHDIAKDMSSWVAKIKTHTEYMSDVITAVKGQAVTLSNEEEISFTVGELLKRVNILMKHELKNAIIYLNISMKADENTIIHGDVNSLVQVINNMISNSIQAYCGKPEQNIDLIVERDNNNLMISVKDYGIGMPKNVKDKLFKEMITTKGKNGTGLGLYMSYSTIRAHFNGNITVESEEEKGTTFHIILPL